MDKLFSIQLTECGLEFGDVSEMVTGILAQVFNVGLKCQMRADFHAKVCDCG